MWGKYDVGRVTHGSFHTPMRTFITHLVEEKIIAELFHPPRHPTAR